MVNLILNQDDAQWNQAYAAVKSDPDNLDYWERLIEHTERVQTKASQEVLHYLRSKQQSEKQKNHTPAFMQIYTTIKSTSREVYDKFLERFPLLFAYWSKYVALEVGFTEEHKLTESTTTSDNNNNTDKSEWWNPLLNVSATALAVHERAVAAFPMSIDLWSAYTTFLVEGLTVDDTSTSTSTSKNTERKKQIDTVHSVFERAAAVIGRDFMSHVFWDEYLAFEVSHSPDNIPKSSLKILSRIVRLPLHQYARYYEQFSEELSSFLSSLYDDLDTAPVDEKTALLVLRPMEVAYLKEKATKKIITPQAILDYFANIIFARTQQGTTDRWAYESLISRSYFHVVELEPDQLENWQSYLTWAENEYQRILKLFTNSRNNDGSLEQEELYWKECITEDVVEDALEQARTLYERALIPCALYDSIWLRYVRWLYSLARAYAQPEGKFKEQSQQLYEDTRNVYRRASNIYVPVTRPFIRFQYSMFEESLGEIVRARDILQAMQEEACEGMTLAATYNEDKTASLLREKIKKKERVERARPWKDASLKRTLKNVDFTEPFFYRIELEKRAGGIGSALRYVQFLLGDENDQELENLLGETNLSTETEGILLKLSKPISDYPEIVTFLVATKALLVAHLYNHSKHPAGRLQLFAQSVALARKYFQDHIIAAKTASSSAAPSLNSVGAAGFGLLSTLPHFWVSYFEFELFVVKKINRLSLESLRALENDTFDLSTKRKNPSTSHKTKRKVVDEDDLDAYALVVKTIQTYMDPLVDLLLSKVGIPPTTINDLVRTYVDDVLMGTIGRRFRVQETSTESVLTRLIKRARIPVDSQATPIKEMLRLGPQSGTLSGSNNVAVSSSSAVIAATSLPKQNYALWPAARAAELETELTGPLIVRTKLLAKLADDGNPDTTRKRLRSQGQEVFV
ncbi:uncharacterized protein SAPINGB_P001492 [Magnusiomyces paraingens]|uniref:Suppressor of forked domain-containing protein n=1 Tax=Magnusiomyces paraingens TaxID=2606893 RepID=A0A5E8B602_9ASCO|nr:uncharacterized protein SAPINGB_P001492 [Saprochaete ingens]VVT46996.1 unnamed protein product [Saprochaete ingens]